MSGCGSGCSCGSDCKCGSGCKCGNYPDLESTTTATTIAGVPSTSIGRYFEESEMSFGAENDCKCGQNCSCSSCSCHN